MTPMTLAEAKALRKMAEAVTPTFKFDHVDAHRLPPVADGVALPDAPAFYVVMRRRKVDAGGLTWTIVHAAERQGQAVEWAYASWTAERLGGME